MYAVGEESITFRKIAVNIREWGRVAGILAATLTFFVGIISVVLGLGSSSPDQSGGSLVVRGLILVGLSVAAGYAASIANRKPQQAAFHFMVIAVLGSIVAFSSFRIAAVALIVAAVVTYSSRKS